MLVQHKGRIGAVIRTIIGVKVINFERASQETIGGVGTAAELLLVETNKGSVDGKRKIIEVTG